MKRESEEKDARLGELNRQLAEVNLRRANMELEMTTEQVEQYEAQKAARKAQNAQRQAQLKMDRRTSASNARKCTHRQGGSGTDRFYSTGKGHSVLSRVILPDERELIMCAVCPLRVFSPREVDKSPKPRANETIEQAKARSRKYRVEREEFDKLIELSKDKLTPEAAAPMHCGTTFSFADGDGRKCDVPAPCDSYAQGRDNREAA
jgi:hypothetical protein